MMFRIFAGGRPAAVTAPCIAGDGRKAGDKAHKLITHLTQTRLTREIK